MNKKLFLGVITVLAVGVFGYFYNQKNEEFKLITNDDELMEFRLNNGDEQEYIKWVEGENAKDLYGGNTPEETLKLYITALKNGDFELASKYFRLEDQEKELILITKEDIEKYILVLETKKEASCSEVFGWCEIRGVFNNVDILLSRLVLNKQTNKWKMESIRN